ncbi:MAG: hypothetical protein NTY94_17140 [Alphaproteobacteria bacterium]|nr:hypothetical protein [Alphaproteobacteria bacterium]
MNASSNVVVRAALPASAPIRPLGIYNGGVVVAVNGVPRAINNNQLHQMGIDELFAGHREILLLWPSPRWPGWSAAEVKQAIITACARLAPVAGDILYDLGVRPRGQKMRAVVAPKRVPLSRFPSRVIPFPEPAPGLGDATDAPSATSSLPKGPHGV